MGSRMLKTLVVMSENLPTGICQRTEFSGTKSSVTHRHCTVRYSIQIPAPNESTVHCVGRVGLIFFFKLIVK
jgi:hypothetical protein